MAAHQARPAPKESVPDGIIAALSERIFKGQIAPGERLPPERELAKQFGTNRTSLREALRALEAQGLVRARQGDGVRVQDFRRHGDISLLPQYFTATGPAEKLEIIMEMMRIRAVLMPEITTYCIERGKEHHRQELRRLHQELAAADKRQDVVAMAEVELSLYRTIVEAGGSLTYLWVFNSLERVVRGFIRAQPQMWIVIPGYVDMWNTIVEHVATRNLPGALEAFQRLLDITKQQVMELFTMLREAAGG